ncbi:transmembrane protein [Anaeramoeba flamelloides]|uniref:Transmembrane protein n=1 Tax=Anaeramoeba flamelloides TaxID=1746091 RepID=A0AAV7YVX4_9EUKA|nr:transmembrane protein [Anaeramoeba flamelloides]
MDFDKLIVFPFNLIEISTKLKILIKYLQTFDYDDLSTIYTELIENFPDLDQLRKNKQFHILFMLKAIIIAEHTLVSEEGNFRRLKKQVLLQKKKNSFLNYIWIVSQLLFADPIIALDIWKTEFFPLLQKQYCTEEQAIQIFDFLEVLFFHENNYITLKNSVDGMIESNLFINYFKLFCTLKNSYGPIPKKWTVTGKNENNNQSNEKKKKKKKPTTHSPNFKKKVYDKMEKTFRLVEELSIFYNLESTPHHYFSKLLSFACSSNPLIRNYSIEYLIKSLQHDNLCFKIWKKIYPLLIPQSNNLVGCIYMNWNDHYLSFNHLDLSDLLDLFVKTNNQIAKNKFKPEKYWTKEKRINSFDIAKINVKTLSRSSQVFRDFKKRIYEPKHQGEKWLFFIAVLIVLLTFIIYFLDANDLTSFESVHKFFKKNILEDIIEKRIKH